MYLKFILLVTVLGISGAAFSEENDCPPSKYNYEVGDQTKSGGWVFYKSKKPVKDSQGKCWQYMETAPEDLKDEKGNWLKTLWTDAYFLVWDNFKELGTGSLNTRHLLNACCQTFGAGKACAELEVDPSIKIRTSGFNGIVPIINIEVPERNIYDDYFLPSKDELFLMISNLFDKEGLNFQRNENYWSSSEEHVNVFTYAWSQPFSSPFVQDYIDIDYETCYVRCARSF